MAPLEILSVPTRAYFHRGITLYVTRILNSLKFFKIGDGFSALDAPVPQPAVLYRLKNRLRETHTLSVFYYVDSWKSYIRDLERIA